MPKGKSVQIKDKKFDIYIRDIKLSGAIKKIAKRINKDYRYRQPVFLSVLNGAFMVTADLMKEIKVESELCFVKLSTYKGTKPGQVVKTIIAPDLDLKNRHILIIEDIVDTGKTMSKFIPQLRKQKPASIEIAALFIKPDAMKYHVEVKYAGLKIPNEFIVGYGLDYDGLGRNLKDIYRITS